MDSAQYAPGTVSLERFISRGKAETILHPRPTNDVNDPLNWPKWSKILNFSLVSFYTLMVFVNLDIGTVIWGDLTVDLDFPLSIETLSFGVNTAGLAVGCVLFIPFALKFGRRPIYLVSIAVDLATAVWQAKMQTRGDLWGTNLVSGLAGSIAETICQMSIADLFFVHQRGTANGIYIIMVNIGAFLAPVAAGYSATSQGWRWIFWWTSILFGACFVLFVFLYEETKYIPLHHGTSSISVHESEVLPHDQRHEGKAGFDIDHKTIGEAVRSSNIPRKTYWQRLSLATTSPGGFGLFFRHVYQPFVILFTFPAVAWTALTYGSLLAWFSVIVSVYSSYFTYPPYNFSASGVGLMNLPPFIGGIFGSAVGAFSDRLIMRLAKRNNGVYEPEMRLWLALPMVVIMPGSILLFGLPIVYKAPWIVSAVGAGVFGFAFAVLGDLALSYLMDSYQEIIGDSLVVVCFVRNGFATVVAMLLTQWIDGVGLAWLFGMCAILAFIFTATTIPMLIWGKKFRINSANRLRKMAERQFGTRD